MSATGQRITFGRDTARMRGREERASNLRAEAFAAPLYGQPALAGMPFRAEFGYCAAAADFLTVAAAVFVADSLTLLRHAGGWIGASMRETITISLLVALVIVLLLKSDGSYRGVVSMLRIRDTERAIRIPVQVFLVLLSFSLLSRLIFFRGAIIGSLLVVPILLVIEKQLVAFSTGRRTGRRVAIYGAGRGGRRIASTLLNSPSLGLRPAVMIDDDSERAGEWICTLGYRPHHSVPVRRGPPTPMLLKSCDCEMLVIVTSYLTQDTLLAVTRAAKQVGMQVACAAHAGAPDWQRTESIDLDGLIITSTGDPIVAWHYPVLKRIADVVLSSLMLTLLAPLLLVVALLIRLDSRGPALFVQRRVGLKGKLFDIYKFRSMYIDAPKYDLSPASSDDQRITRVGRFLRRTSLDELPQLINVLLGNMSLVGPRPEMPFIVDLYDTCERQRLEVVPGITGLWQLSADRIFPIHENIEYDLYYIKNRSFFLDVAILMHTAFFAMRGV
jgi:exopolysaccharide biosynthesis polyprenyl glycosylphosphotransferase